MFSQSVPHIAAAAGAGQDCPKGRSQPPAVLFHRSRTENPLPAVHNPFCAVQKARLDMSNGSLESETAFSAAAEALIKLGI